MPTYCSYSSDTDFLLALKNGDENCLYYLYNEHSASLINFVLKNKGGYDEANDIAQQAVITVFEKVQNPAFRLTCSVNTYLYSIARNLWLKELRRKGKSAMLTDTMPEFVNVKVEDYNEEEDRLINEMMKTFVNKLGENCQKVLTLFYWNCYKFEEIARKLGYNNADTAKQQKAKCLKQLREKCGIIKKLKS
ncbi:MAG TPA: sigma-70 family RNA polymerase sigma factor [Chitinophagales bacterium]|nr:sigma-70 family RNA polymerase sigma factor [Chitinophagales bacterium]HRK26044.1 sigma-70 family RNA polymerase sigma factor [Chitinophagales bacterium]